MPLKLYDTSLGRYGVAARYHRFTSTTAATAMESGHPLTLTDTAADASWTASGLTMKSTASTAERRIFIETPHVNPKRIGGTFRFATGGTALYGQQIALIGWVTPQASPSFQWAASVHFLASRWRWSIGYIDIANGTFTAVTSGGYTTGALPTDTDLTFEIVLNGTTATVSLPDGSSATSTDSHYAGSIGSAAWETYQLNPQASGIATIVAGWSDGANVAEPSLASRLVARPRTPMTASVASQALGALTVPTSLAEVSSTLRVSNVQHEKGQPIEVDMYAVMANVGGAIVVWVPRLFELDDSGAYAQRSTDPFLYASSEAHANRSIIVRHRFTTTYKVDQVRWYHYRVGGSSATISSDAYSSTILSARQVV